ncbi:MAG: hypothetical protein K6G25_02475 [Bacteroidales bacterium]|nr:hypothetical protein [Bacteroidales bacterium]
MDTSNNFQLNGTNEEKAKQLANRIKLGGLSKERLDAILPHEKEFFKCLVEVFRAQLDAESKDYKVYVDTINNSISNLCKILPDENLDVETRRQIIDLIVKLTDDLKDVQESRNDDSRATKIGLGILAVAMLGIAAWLGFGGIGNNDNNKT